MTTPTDDLHADADDTLVPRLASLLGTVPEPRRTDDAFARSVAADVASTRQRRRFWLAIPTLGAAAAALALVVTSSNPGDADAGDLTDPSGELAMLGSDDDVAEVADDTLLALAGTFAVEDEDPDFASDTFTLSALDGSTEQELRQLEAALDRALAL